MTDTHLQRDQSISRRAAEIYTRSKPVALRAIPDELEMDDGEIVMVAEKRSHAMAYAAGEFGCDFIDVRCTRQWMCIDLAAIKDKAYDIAQDEADGNRDFDSEALAYTWPYGGWLWTNCKRTDPGAVGFWRAVEKVRA